MKRAALALWALALLASACGGEDATAEVELRPVSEPGNGTGSVQSLPMPAYGGTVLMVGSQPMEVVTDREGTIDAYHIGSLPPAPQDAQLTVRVPDAAGQVRPVLLTWDPGERRYRGRLRGALPAPGPFELVLVIGGQTTRARAPTFVLIDAPRVAVRAPSIGEELEEDEPFLDVDEPAPPDVNLRVGGPPPGPQVVVIDGPPPPPRPGVVIAAPPPPPRPGVVIAAPPPPPRPGVVIAAPPPPPPSRVLVAAPPPPPSRVVVAAPPPPPPSRVVVAAPPPPPPSRVVVAAPPPPPPSRVVVAAPPPPPRGVVVAAPPPPPRPGVVVVRERDDGRGRGRDDDDRGRGRGRGDDDDDDDDRGRGRRDDHPGRGHGNAHGRRGRGD